MPRFDAERIEIADRVRTLLAPENLLTPIQARSFVRSLQAFWEVEQNVWADEETTTQFDGVRKLFLAAGIYQKTHGVSSEKAKACYRRAAEILEWLARSRDETQTTVPIPLLAAGAFQLAGLPAMASALLQQNQTEESGEQIISCFLQADLAGVLQHTRRFWQENLDLCGREGSSELLTEGGADGISWYLTVEIIRSLGLFSDSLRRGDMERNQLAIQKLKAIQKSFRYRFSYDLSLLLMLIDSSATQFLSSTIYKPITELAEINPSKEGRLKRFARKQYEMGRGILWPTQKAGLDRLISESSFALCTPTGSGKTLVANLALVKELLLEAEGETSPLGLYLVPSRALAVEVEAKLNAELSTDLVVTGLYGGNDWGVTDFWINADKPAVLIATVEKAEALIRYLGVFFVARLRLLILDEAHQVVHDKGPSSWGLFSEHRDRSLRLESFVSRLLTLTPDIKRIALTAVAGGAAGPVSRWVEGDPNADALGVNYRSTRQLIGKLQNSPTGSGRIEIDLLNGKGLGVRGRRESVYISLRTPPMPQLPATQRNSIYNFNEVKVLWTALHLADQDRRILISLAQAPETTMARFCTALRLPDWAEISEFEIPQASSEREIYEETLAACIDYCGEDSFEVELLRRGIATSHGQLPQRVRRLMTRLIELRICPVTLATATLTEGVNLPFDLVFVTSLKRTTFDPNAGEDGERTEIPISTGEFLNLAGRAGRPGATKGMDGLTLVAIPSAPSSTAASIIPRQRNQIRILEEEYDSLVARVLEYHTSDGTVYSPLSELLSGIAEQAQALLGITPEDFLTWLERVLPEEISAQAGAGSLDSESMLADGIDELDNVLLSAVEELNTIREGGIEAAELEQELISLWSRTFTHFAADTEEWLERAFVKRGIAVSETIYPDRAERATLYQYGYTPCVGKRFINVAPNLKEILSGAEEYGGLTKEEQISFFVRIGELVSGDRGFGFRVRQTAKDEAILDNWIGVLRWWMNVDDDNGPEPTELRRWQRFVADNLEFRLSVAIGAVVAQVWSNGVTDPTEVPTLERWREVTELPWFGFWARELIRWGTLDPFIAFSLSQGLTKTRSSATDMRTSFETWLSENGEESIPENLIDPQLMMKWKHATYSAEPSSEASIIQATIIGGERSKQNYNVIPVKGEGETIWIDPAGFMLARSEENSDEFYEQSIGSDFELVLEEQGSTVRPSFRPDR